MEGHFAALANLDIDTAALALSRMGMIPRAEPVAARHDDDIGPTGFEILGPARLDSRHLRRPEGIGIGKEAVLAEQVGHGRKLGFFDIE